MSHTHKTRRIISLAVLVAAPCRFVRAQDLDSALFATELARQPLPETPAPLATHPALQSLAAHADDLGREGRYDEQLATLDYATGLTLHATEGHHEEQADTAAMQSLFELGLRLDGAGRLADAVRIFNLALTLAQPYRDLHGEHFMLTLQLALAHAQRDAGDTTAAVATCNHVDMDRIPAAEIRAQLLGSRRVLEAHKQLFCGEEAAGKAALAQQIAAHPHRGEPHQVLAEYDLATHQWADATTEQTLWLQAADTTQALTPVH